MHEWDKIYVAGHTGLAGSAIMRAVMHHGYMNVVVRTHAELDLTNSSKVYEFFKRERPDYVVLAAGKVGGILANSIYPADFIRENLLIQTNVIDAAYRYGCKKLLFLGSSCVYPKYAPQPIKEDCLLSGELEETNQAYAIAKIAGIQMCSAYNQQYGATFVTAMPTNLYGPGDNFDLDHSHVLPALIRKFHEAKMFDLPEVVIWGNGRSRREFLHANDLAEACLVILNHYDSSKIINIGAGKDITISELAEIVREVSEYTGAIVFDPNKPDGTPRKLLDIGQLKNLGWTARVSLRDGIRSTYEWFSSVLWKA